MTSYSKLFEKIRIRPEGKDKAQTRSNEAACQWDGCNAPGTHRAPVGRMREGEYFRFCFDHVREYNKGFNYFSGLADTDIARFQKEALTGHRPTWKMGANTHAASAPDFSQKRSGAASYYNRVRDPFGVLGEREKAPRQRRLKTLEAKAMETLGLTENATSDAIKARYKELVKQHHPDANGGDRGSEERLRDVLQAYRVLRQAGLC